MTREELLYTIGKWLGYWAGHYDGWMRAAEQVAEWNKRYSQIVDDFIEEAEQAETLITLLADPERRRELATQFWKEATRGLTT